MKNLTLLVATCIFLTCLWLGTGLSLPQGDLIIATKFPDPVPAKRPFDVQVALENPSDQALQIVGFNNC